MIFNRKTIRDYLVAQLAPALTTALHTYGYMATGFEGESPIVRVVNAGSDRPPFSQQVIRSRFYYTIQLFVLCHAEGLTSAQNQTLRVDAEDRLDALEYELYSWVSTHQQVEDYWQEIAFDGRSQTTVVLIGTSNYILEEIPFVVRVDG